MGKKGSGVKVIGGMRKEGERLARSRQRKARLFESILLKVMLAKKVDHLVDILSKELEGFINRHDLPLDEASAIDVFYDNLILAVEISRKKKLDEEKMNRRNK